MIRDNYRKYIMWISIAIMYILCFKLVITSGYMFDDMWSSVDLGIAINNDTTLGRMVLGDINRWVTSYGRILIFSFYSDFVLNYLPRVLYKSFIVGAMFLNGLVLGGVIRELTDSKKLTYLTVIMFPAVISLRASYYTGVYAFHGLVQVCFLMVLLAVYSYIRYRKTGKVRFQVISCIFWFISLGTYEVAYVLCFCFIIALICIDGWDYVKNHFWKSVKTGLPQIIIEIAWIIANVVTRFLASGDYDGATPNMSLGNIVSTFFKQCSGSLGFGAAIKDFHLLSFAEWIEFIKTNVGLLEILSYLFLFILLMLALMYVKDEKFNNVCSMTTMGILLIVMPSVLISVSVKYQKEVEWFSGYIPAYFGSWGFAIIFAILIVMVGRKYANNRITFIIINLSCALILTIIFAVNSIVGSYSVQQEDVFYQNDVDTMADGIDAGILNDIGMDYVLDTSYSMYAYRPTCTNNAYTTWLREKNNIYGWDDIYEDKGQSTELNELYQKMDREGFKVLNHLAKWYVVIADCNSLELNMNDDGYNYKAYTDSINMFLYDYSPDVFTCSDINGKQYKISRSDGEVISTGRYGKVYRFNFPDNINISSIVIGD